MNKRVIFTIISSVLLIGGALIYVLLSPKIDSSVDQEVSVSEEKTPATAPQADTPSMVQPGVYVEYSESAVQNTKGVKLLFFHASWCPQCREIEASIKDGGVPSGVTVFKIDYDSNQDLRQKYGVTLQTTFVKIDDEGNKIKSYVAYEEPQFSSVERELLK